MSSQLDDSLTGADAAVAEAVDEYLERIEAGESLDPAEFAAAHPAIADLLRELLPAVAVLRQSGLSSSRGDADSDAQAVNGREIGDYRLVCEIGRGGMGIVYEAMQMSLSRRVALKVLPLAAALDGRRLERFKNEAQAAAGLHHGHIVPVYAVGCDDGIYFYAMQLIAGQSVAELIGELKQASDGKLPRRTDLDSGATNRSATLPYGHLEVAPSATTEASPVQGPDAGSNLHEPADPAQVNEAASTQVQSQTEVSPESKPVTLRTATINSLTRDPAEFCQRAARWGIQAAEALHYAHGQGIVHRDVKPANLLIDEDGQLWVTDFGLARLASDSNLTATGDLLGTFRYMSPEQARGSVVDPRSDIYSLGATLYELLTLVPAHDCDQRELLLQTVLEQEPLPIRRRNRHVPVDLETIVLKALSKDPANRYADARELADDLRRFLDCRPILARRPSWSDVAGKWCRRHRSLVASLFVGLALATAALAVSNVLVARERTKTQAAYEQVALRQSATERALAEEARQRAAADAAWKAESTQRELAEKNFSQAREMLDFVLLVCEEDLASVPEMQAVRSRLLQEALAYYQDFIRQSRNNPPLQAELAQSHLRVAKILHAVGSSGPAKAALERALETQEALVREYPDDRDLRRGLFSMYFELGVMRGQMRLFLVSRSSVGEHLGLNDEQREKLDQVGDRQRELFEAFFDSEAADPSGARKQFQAHTEVAQATVAELLDESQLARLEQLSLQRRGTHAFRDREVADQLGLTEEQRLQINALANEPFRKGRREDRQRRSTVDERVMALLTDVQQSKWQELIGEPFHFDHGRRHGHGPPGDESSRPGRPPPRPERDPA